MRLHLFLRGTDIIGDAIETYQLLLAVKDGVGSVRITIAGLPDTAGIDNQSSLICCHRVIRQEVSRRDIFGLVAIEHNRLVRVAYQTEWCLEVSQVLKGGSSR